jgi:hypothetical protein
LNETQRNKFSIKKTRNNFNKANLPKNKKDDKFLFPKSNNKIKKKKKKKKYIENKKFHILVKKMYIFIYKHICLYLIFFFLLNLKKLKHVQSFSLIKNVVMHYKLF